MHQAAYDFVEGVTKRLYWPSSPSAIGLVLEIGSRNLNGSVRPLFAPGHGGTGASTSYVGIDLLDGPGVDIVADGSTFEPPVPPDVVVCTEVLEHFPKAWLIVRNALKVLSPGGALIVTCAGPGRVPHSAITPGPLQPGEYYGNISRSELVSWCETARFAEATYTPGKEDLYLLVYK